MNAVSYILCFIVAGLLLQLGAAIWPVRRFEERQELLIDLAALLIALVSQVAIASAAFPWIARLQDFGPVHLAHERLSSLPPLAAGLFYFVATDFLAYWMHRLNHWSWLWSTHAFHHSTRNIYWASGMRGSPVHFLLLGLPALIVQVVFSPQGPVMTLVLAYGVVHNSLIHSNLKIPTRLLNRIFVTGETHFVHHGRDPRLGGSNFGFLLTIWDRLFGTWTDPQSLPKNFPLGLGYEVGAARLMVGLPPRASR